MIIFKTIKKLLLVLLFVPFTCFAQELNDDTITKVVNIESAEVTATPYCDGWEEGYCEGYKDVKGEWALCPIIAICPMAELMKTEYKHGYHRGFKAGMKKAGGK